MGKIIAETAAKNLTRCILELGGKCPTVVHPTADLAHVTEKICWAKFSNSGQTCIAPDYLFVHEDVVERFFDMMIDCIKRFWGDDPNGSDQLGKIINKFHVDRLTKLL